MLIYKRKEKQMENIDKIIENLKEGESYADREQAFKDLLRKN